jgi:glycerate-2-kinase
VQEVEIGCKKTFLHGGGRETTVSLRGGGLGGRNQELALAAVDALRGIKNVMLVTLATDGEDGTLPGRWLRGKRKNAPRRVLA